MTQLTSLGLNDNSISNISALSGMTSMLSLHLHNNSISDISALSGMTSMTALYLYNNSVSDISALSGMTSMITLDLRNNNISDVSAVSGMTSLSILSVAGNPISDYGPLRTLKAANPNVFIDIGFTNNPPVFTEGTSTTRSVAERTASGTNTAVQYLRRMPITIRSDIVSVARMQPCFALTAHQGSCRRGVCWIMKRTPLIL